MLLKNRGIVGLIVVIFICIIYFYRSAKNSEIENALFEHSLVVAAPMWNMDTDWLGKYLQAVAEKYNYQSLEIFDDGGELFQSTLGYAEGGLDKILSRWWLIPRKRFEKEIFHEDELLGKIVIVWRDTSIYFYSYACLIFLLLVVIVNLYTSVVTAKQKLEGKVKDIEETMAELQKQKDFIEDIFDVVPEGLITIDREKNRVSNNRSFDTIVERWAAILDRDMVSLKKLFFTYLRDQLVKRDNGQYSMMIDDYTISIEFSSSSAISTFHDIERVVSLRDITKLTSMERQLAQAQKLEAVGRLAAGIAHEINTPTQYVSANIEFLSEAHDDVTDIMAKVNLLLETADKSSVSEAVAQVKDSVEEADWEYLEEELPKALSQSKEGLRRIAGIVGAMKHFSHPSGNEVSANDINSAIKNTVEVARNEWKYVAEVDLQLDPSMPMVPCFLDELNQVFLSMIVNSSHAIEDKYTDAIDKKGKITIKTQVLNGMAVIIVADDGGGMSEAVKGKVFDPFFTTKELNKGTGQGLAIVHDVVVNRHKGNISVESEEGVGTTFTISLPL